MLGKPSISSNYPSVSIGASGSTACSAKNTSQICVLERKYSDKRLSRKAKKEMSGVQFDSFEEASKTRVTSSTSSNRTLSKDAYINHKLRKNDILGEDISKQHDTSGPTVTSSRISVHERNEHENLWEPRGKSGDSRSSHSACGIGHEIGLNLNPDNGITSDDEKVESKCSPELISMKENITGNSESHSTGTKCSKSTNLAFEAVSEQPCSEEERMGEVADASKFARMRDANANPAPGSTDITSLGVMRVMGLKKSPKFFREYASGVGGGEKKKLKMLFPYEEFVKYFQSEVFNLSPRGLLNCGNSCYANAVLQCLMCTKPLSNYLLQRSHSKSCFVKAKDWCLMCDLEQHVTMLRDSGGALSGAPLSPSNILLHMRSINCQIGDGSQEDAHEFLRFLVTSMQSICLEGLGAESQIDPKLQETTFIQHTFGGRLMSKVKCLRCHHESERYENIMDLSLEILGWVESLEDALTQFTTPEDLDGENMYRCGRCATYVRARKQLSIQDAPNILTIVLKRFQEGRYGKINKCITFPDMLDMVPFMTGTDDVPPLYMLYAVVVHLDTLNASFSGHYVSYVKDFQGNWFRIDDTEVQPVLMSQVMSEGAYILFYMRSCPRPPRALTGKTLQHRAATSSRQCRSKPQKSSRLGHSKPSNYVDGPEPLPNFLPKASATYSEPIIEFSDATSSDWSLFTSSDDASFTTESTRDSFSTVDYADTCGIDPISSIFNTSYGPEYSRRTFACKTSSKSRLQTRFFLEEKGYVVNLSAQPLDRVDKAEEFKQFGDRPIELAYDGNCIASVKYGNIPNHGHGRTSAHCKV